jgi:argininosuccinate lyase
MVPRLGNRADRMLVAADGLALATDLADQLDEHGVPYRDAQAVVGGLVPHCDATGNMLRDLVQATLRRHSSRLTRAMVRALTPARSLARRRVIGGTAPREVARQLARAKRELAP